MKKVFVSGCFDMLHSGHVAFFKDAAAFGDLYVGIGSDTTVRELKKRDTVYSETERLYMVKSIKYVKDAFINKGSGMIDFADTVNLVKPDIFVVNEDGGSDAKRMFCEKRGIEYIVLQGKTDEQSGTSVKDNSQLPYRLDLAGTWIDQPYVSEYGAGWAITISLEPTVKFMERGGMSTSTRNAARKIWPYKLPDYNYEMLARLVFCFENEPAQNDHVSGAQDAIGICMPGLNRHYYNRNYWPEKIESCYDEEILSWLEDHVCMIPMFPRPDGCSVVTGMDINTSKVKALSGAADKCWNAIMKRDLHAFAETFQQSFDAQISMFPAMMTNEVQRYIDMYKDKALAWKMSGAGGGGYLALVCDEIPSEAIRLTIRRPKN